MQSICICPGEKERIREVIMGIALLVIEAVS
jgi:hypothetical protein